MIKIAIVRLSSLGDIVKNASVLQFIKRYYSNSEISWVVDSKFGDILDDTPYLDKVIKINLKWLKKGLSLKNIKELYSQNVLTLKEIEKESVFDAFYGLYNKNYFLRETKREIAQIKKFKHTSSLIVCRVANGTMDRLRSEKSKIVVNRFISKIMLKTSRRTDIIAHLGDGIFGMLLRHTDRVGAMKTSERLSDTITNSAMFIEGDELEVNISLGIAEILPEKDENKLLECAYKKLDEAQKENSLYKICEE